MTPGEAGAALFGAWILSLVIFGALIAKTGSLWWLAPQFFVVVASTFLIAMQVEEPKK